MSRTVIYQANMQRQLQQELKALQKQSRIKPNFKLNCTCTTNYINYSSTVLYTSVHEEYINTHTISLSIKYPSLSKLGDNLPLPAKKYRVVM